jgi:DNA invertase Pin-like site-specific DNA recombinase
MNATNFTVKRTVRYIPPVDNLAMALSNEEIPKRRVAAYARVSTDREEQETSFEAQVDYYTNYIKNNNEWEFASVYADEGISATNTNKRDGFKRMVSDSLAGKIDLIVTKSVSRFARNTVDSLTAVRQLKENGVEVYFEKENIYTFDSKGELLITIMSSLAQEESRSISENVKWGKRKRFADGKFTMPYKRFLGYEKGPDGLPEIVESEAEIIRRIYRLFLYGKSVYAIAAILTNDGIPTPTGKKKWFPNTVESILTNEKYKGDALLQKKFTVDFLTKKQKTNEGEIPQYYVEGSHPAIVEPDIFDLAQAEMKKRKSSGKQSSSVHPFSGKIICGECGNAYGSKVWHSNTKYRREVWNCNGKHYGGQKCGTKHLTDEDIRTAFISAFNTVLDGKAEIIKDYEEIRELLTDTSEIETAATEAGGEYGVYYDALKKLVGENANTALNQDEYRRKYEAYADKLKAAREKISALDAERLERTAKGAKITGFIRTLQNRDGLISDFDEELWYISVDAVTVKKDELLFTFKNGSAITIQTNV